MTRYCPACNKLIPAGGSCRCNAPDPSKWTVAAMDSRAANYVLYTCPCGNTETVTLNGAKRKKACKVCAAKKGRVITDRIRQDKKAWGETIKRRPNALRKSQKQ